MTTVHSSPLSGYWYPKDSGHLRDLLEQLFADSSHRTGNAFLDRAVAFVVPHAGLIYSGTVAASAYRQARHQKAERAIVLGFSHRWEVQGVAIPRISSFSTPLGELEIDLEAARQLCRHEPFRFHSEEYLCDHSIEIQLPLLQAALPGARILPLYVGSLDEARRVMAGEALAELAEPGTVFYASSDFTHYGKDFHYEPFPADAAAPGNLRVLDERLMEASGSLNPDLFNAVRRETDATLCGYHPIGLLLETLRRVRGEEIFQTPLDYQTSGEITGEFGHSVSYASLGYFPVSAFALSPEDCDILLDCAANALERWRQTGKREVVRPAVTRPALARGAGVFVSLHQRGELRGCVGCRTATRRLSEAVPELTLSAALDDGRFDRIRRGDSELDIEIHVLTPMKLVTGPGDFLLHEHGAFLDAEDRQGLLLPRVASDHGLSKEEFFAALARKAGVGTDIYGQRGTKLYVFRAQSFERKAKADPAQASAS